MQYPRVETCSVCKKDFWASSRDNGICSSCSFKIWKENEAEQIKQKQDEIKKPIEKPSSIILEKKTKTEIVKTERDLEKERQAQLYEANQLFGYVYLMRSGNGYHKIGISKKVENRLGGLKRQFPVLIEVIHCFACHDYRKVEKDLHQKFSTKRIEYEWFELDENDVQWIASLQDYELG